MSQEFRKLYSFIVSLLCFLIFLLLMQKVTPRHRKCYLCGVSSQISDLAIFDVSRKSIPGYSACKYLCERHFDPSDLIEYVDGKKQ